MDPEERFTREVGQRVRAARESHEPRMTQDELGEKLGLSRVAYGHYERGATPFNILQLYRIANILGLPLESLLGVQGPTRQDESALLAAYRRLDGSVHQARVLATVLDLCRIWAETPTKATTDQVDAPPLMPLLIVQQAEDGRLRLLQQGVVDAVPDLAEGNEQEQALLREFRRMLPEKRSALMGFITSETK